MSPATFSSLPIFLVEIVRHTPLWVWALLALLIVLGRRQMQDQAMGRARVIALPLVMMGWSLWSASSALGAHGAIVAAWAVGVALAIGLGQRLPASAASEPRADGRVTLPGSPWPLVGMLAIFASRYVVTVTLLLHPDTAAGPFAPVMALLYGALSGAFVARALRGLKAAGFGPGLRLAA